MKKIMIIICILLNITGCSKYAYKEEKLDNRIIIEKISIDNKYNIVSLNDNVIGIVMFSECGRPDKKGTNTVIGAHSGIGSNAYFNDISKLKNGDLINVIYDNILYSYSVTEVKIVNDTNVQILDDNNKSILTLLTCKFGEKGKRIVVVSELIVDL